MYKFSDVYIAQKKISVLSTETITDIGATINTHNEQFFKDHEMGKLKLNTFFLDEATWG